MHQVIVDGTCVIAFLIHNRTSIFQICIFVDVLWLDYLMKVLRCVRWVLGIMVDTGFWQVSLNQVTLFDCWMSDLIRAKPRIFLSDWHINHFHLSDVRWSLFFFIWGVILIRYSLRRHIDIGCHFWWLNKVILVRLDLSYVRKNLVFVNLDAILAVIIWLRKVVVGILFYLRWNFSLF